MWAGIADSVSQGVNHHHTHLDGSPISRSLQQSLINPPSTFYAWTHDTDHCAKKTPLGYKRSAGGSIWLILGPSQRSHEVPVAGEESHKQLPWVFNCLHMRRFPSYIITFPSQTHYIAPIISLLIYSAHRRNCVSVIVISSCSFSCWLPWADVLLCQSQPLSLNHNLSQIQRLMLITDIGVAPIFFYITLSYLLRKDWSGHWSSSGNQTLQRSK